MKETKSCVYDNPATCCREGYIDGRLVFSYKMTLMLSKAWPPPAEKFHLGANVGDWNSGQIIGDELAMIRKTEQIEKFTKAQWSACGNGDVNFEVCHVSQDVSVYSSDKPQSARHDALLIAAAPDMYAMLKQIQIEGGLGVARHRQIDRVLAKARGEV